MPRGAENTLAKHDLAHVGVLGAVGDEYDREEDMIAAIDKLVQAEL